jgi:hypothetical protein
VSTSCAIVRLRPLAPDFLLPWAKEGSDTPLAKHAVSCMTCRRETTLTGNMTFLRTDWDTVAEMA